MADISEFTKAWATEQLWNRIRDLADDPHGVCDYNIDALPQIWNDYCNIARDLNCDAEKIVYAVATQYEATRLFSMLKFANAQGS